MEARPAGMVFEAVAPGAALLDRRTVATPCRHRGVAHLVAKREEVRGSRARATIGAAAASERHDDASDCDCEARNHVPIVYAKSPHPQPHVPCLRVAQGGSDISGN